MAARKFFLLLFILLQGLGPLLHAHAGTTHQSGIHLPDGYTLADYPGPTLHSQDSDEPPAFTMDISLGARELLVLPGTLVSLIRIADDTECRTLSWVPVSYEAPDPPGIHHLIPPTCAPPRA